MEMGWERCSILDAPGMKAGAHLGRIGYFAGATAEAGSTLFMEPER
jgi:hypothetical protein